MLLREQINTNKKVQSFSAHFLSIHARGSRAIFMVTNDVEFSKLKATKQKNRSLQEISLIRRKTNNSRVKLQTCRLPPQRYAVLVNQQQNSFMRPFRRQEVLKVAKFWVCLNWAPAKCCFN